MAKRKNPLKDLDAFLKQEAKNFVQPNKVEETTKEESATTYSIDRESNASLDQKEVIKFLSELKIKDSDSFYQVLKSATEKSGLESSENKMLVNTILYLQNKEGWKEAIKDYWS